MKADQTVPNTKSVTLNVPGGTVDADTLLVFDQDAWNEFVDKQTKELEKIGKGLELKIEEVEKKADKAKTEAVAEATKVIDTKLTALGVKLTERHNQINLHLKGLNDKIDTTKAELTTKIGTDITTAIDNLKQNELKKVYEFTVTNKDSITKLRSDMEFHNNGDIHFCGFINESSTDVEGKTEGKDAFLTDYITKNGFPNGPINGYFVKCNDGVNFFYMEDKNKTKKWHKTEVAAGFTVNTPLKMEQGALSLCRYYKWSFYRCY